MDISGALSDSNFPLATVIGSLLWIANVARPDIAFTVNQVSCFLTKPTDSAILAAKHCIRYLLGMKNLGITFNIETSSHPGCIPQFTACSDSDWVSDTADFKSTTGYVIMLNNGPICWRSRKQTVVAKSSAEAEYIAASTCAQEVLGFRSIYNELGQSLDREPTSIYVENNSAISMTQNDVDQSRAKTKSLSVSVHHVKDHIALKHI